MLRPAADCGASVTVADHPSRVETLMRSIVEYSRHTPTTAVGVERSKGQRRHRQSSHSVCVAPVSLAMPNREAEESSFLPADVGSSTVAAGRYDVSVASSSSTSRDSSSVMPCFGSEHQRIVSEIVGLFHRESAIAGKPVLAFDLTPPEPLVVANRGVPVENVLSASASTSNLQHAQPPVTDTQSLGGASGAESRSIDELRSLGIRDRPETSSWRRHPLTLRYLSDDVEAEYLVHFHRHRARIFYTAAFGTASIVVESIRLSGALRNSKQLGPRNAVVACLILSIAGFVGLFFGTLLLRRQLREASDTLAAISAGATVSGISSAVTPQSLLRDVRRNAAIQELIIALQCVLFGLFMIASTMTVAGCPWVDSPLGILHFCQHAFSNESYFLLLFVTPAMLLPVTWTTALVVTVINVLLMFVSITWQLYGDDLGSVSHDPTSDCGEGGALVLVDNMLAMTKMWFFAAYAAVILHGIRRTEKSSRTEFEHVTVLMALREEATQLHDALAKQVTATMPAGVARRMLSGERVNDVHPAAGVFVFTIPRFAAWASMQSSSSVVEELNRIFCVLDSLVAEHPNLLKMQTLGDMFVVIGAVRISASASSHAATSAVASHSQCRGSVTDNESVTNESVKPLSINNDGPNLLSYGSGRSNPGGVADFVASATSQAAAERASPTESCQKEALEEMVLRNGHSNRSSATGAGASAVEDTIFFLKDSQPMGETAHGNVMPMKSFLRHNTSHLNNTFMMAADTSSRETQHSQFPQTVAAHRVIASRREAVGEIVEDVFHFTEKVVAALQGTSYVVVLDVRPIVCTVVAATSAYIAVGIDALTTIAHAQWNKPGVHMTSQFRDRLLDIAANRQRQQHALLRSSVCAPTTVVLSPKGKVAIRINTTVGTLLSQTPRIPSSDDETGSPAATGNLEREWMSIVTSVVPHQSGGSDPYSHYIAAYLGLLDGSDSVGTPGVQRHSSATVQTAAEKLNGSVSFAQSSHDADASCAAVVTSGGADAENLAQPAIFEIQQEVLRDSQWLFFSKFRRPHVEALYHHAKQSNVHVGSQYKASLSQAVLLSLALLMLRISIDSDEGNDSAAFYVLTVISLVVAVVGLSPLSSHLNRFAPRVYARRVIFYVWGMLLEAAIYNSDPRLPVARNTAVWVLACSIASASRGIALHPLAHVLLDFILINVPLWALFMWRTNSLRLGTSDAPWTIATYVTNFVDVSTKFSADTVVGPLKQSDFVSLVAQSIYLDLVVVTGVNFILRVLKDLHMRESFATAFSVNRLTKRLQYERGEMEKYVRSIIPQFMVDRFESYASRAELSSSVDPWQGAWFASAVEELSVLVISVSSPEPAPFVTPTSLLCGTAGNTGSLASQSPRVASNHPAVQFADHIHKTMTIIDRILREQFHGAISVVKFVGDQVILSGSRSDSEIVRARELLECASSILRCFEGEPFGPKLVLNSGLGVGAVIGSDRLTFELFGEVVSTAMELLNAMPTRGIVATQRFLNVVARGNNELMTFVHRSRDPLEPSTTTPIVVHDVCIQPPYVWKVRGSAATSVFAVSPAP